MTTNCPVVISFDFQHEYDRGNNMYFHLNLLYFRKRITFHHNNSALSLESISKVTNAETLFFDKGCVNLSPSCHPRNRNEGMRDEDRRIQTNFNKSFVCPQRKLQYPPALLSAPWRISQSRGNTSGRSTALKETTQCWHLHIYGLYINKGTLLIYVGPIP